MSEAAIAVVPSDQLERVRTLGAITRIETADAEAVAVDGLAFIQTVARNLEKARTQLVGPLNTKVKEINATFKAMTEPIGHAEERVKSALLDWRRRERERIEAEQARVRRENEERERAAAEEVAKQTAAVIETTVEQAVEAGFSQEEAAQLADMEAADVVAAPVITEVAPAPVANTTRSTLGSAVGRMVWKFAVTDPAMVPRAYLAVDEKAIRLAMNAGIRDIPGVRFFQEESIAGRSAS